jgi:hypothetical protein
MSNKMLWAPAVDDLCFPELVQKRPGSQLRDLFVPLDRLLVRGGDPRLSISPASGLNDYGCQPFPCPDTLSFASSTATSISQRAYDRASLAREALMWFAITDGLEAAFDARLEEMRDELKAHLRLSQSEVDVVFSPSGTDAQLQALFLVRTLLGPALTTVIVAADQTGSGTAHTARGCHFSVATANGSSVRKGEPISGLAHSVASVALGLLDATGDAHTQADMDSLVLDAIEKAIAGGTRVLLQIMDSSKLGWRAPSEVCLDEISRRWPDQVQIVVDACQMRLGRPRLKKYLDRGYMVLVTGSKFFTGPPFSGALLVPARLAKVFEKALDGAGDVAPGLLEYSSRSDWPKNWQVLRSQFPVRANFGQWLRWEAALEEIQAYYSVPDEFRLSALATFGTGVEKIIASSRSLRLLPPQERVGGHGLLDEELDQRTIFPFVIVRDGRALSLEECKKVYRALAHDLGGAFENSPDAEIASEICLIGQPVALRCREGYTAAALRICAGARLVAETWSGDDETARDNLQHELDHVATIVAKIEWLTTHIDDLNLTEKARGH